MEAHPSAPAKGVAPVAASPPSLRALGAVVFVFFLLTSAVGGSLALESSYLPVTLLSHIGLALVTLGLAAYSGSIARRWYRSAGRASAGLSGFCALGATVAGTVYLLAGQNPLTLSAMEALAGVGLLASILMIIFGGATGRRPSDASTP